RPASAGRLRWPMVCTRSFVSIVSLEDDSNARLEAVDEAERVMDVLRIDGAPIKGNGMLRRNRIEEPHEVITNPELKSLHRIVGQVNRGLRLRHNGEIGECPLVLRRQVLQAQFKFRPFLDHVNEERSPQVQAYRESVSEPPVLSDADVSSVHPVRNDVGI